MQRLKLAWLGVGLFCALGCAQQSVAQGSSTGSGSDTVSPFAEYRFHRDIKINGKVPPAYSLSLAVDHAKLVKDKKARKDGNDVRVTYELEGTITDLQRVVDPSSEWNQPATLLWFRTPDKLGGAGIFRLYYGNEAPVAPLADPTKVYDAWEDYEAAFDDPSWKLTKIGAADGKTELKKVTNPLSGADEGALRLSGQSNDFGAEADDGVFFHRTISGDFQADAQILNAGGSLGGAAKMGGLMVRQSADKDSIFAMVSITFGAPIMGQKDLPHQRLNMSRAKKGDMANSTPLMAGDKFPQLVEVTRLANQVSSAYSDDGINWIAIGTPATLKDLLDPVLLGIPFSNISSDFGYADIGWLRIIKRMAPPPTTALSPEK